MGPEAASQLPRISFGRLPEEPLAVVRELLNETRNWRHLPLAGTFSTAATADWVRAKDEQWNQNGYGPWAIRIDDEFAGWGGFQREGDLADFGLVLHPRFWGMGAEITRLALVRGFTDLGLTAVTIALPFSRNVDRTLGRLGFRPDGEVTHGTVRFRRFRLTRSDWQRAWSTGPRPATE